MISDKVFDAVLDCILHSEADTREKIAQKIGYSAATVGKSVNWLLDAGIIEQKMVSGKGAGRKTGILSLCPDKRFCVINLSCRRFEFSVFDTRLKLQENFSKNTDLSLAKTDELRTFLNEVRILLDGSADCSELSFGVIFPSHDSKENSISETSETEFYADEALMLVCDAFGVNFPSVFSEDNALLGAILKHPRMSNFSRVFYLGISDHISSVLAENGSRIDGVNAAYSLSGDGTLKNALFGDGAYENCTEKIAHVLANVVTLCAPELILLEGKLIRIANDIYDKLLELCEPSIPTSRIVINKNAPFADDLGAVIAMRDAYIKQKIEKIKARRKKNNYDFEY